VATTPPTGQEPAGTTSPEPATFDLAYVKQLRTEAAEARTRLKALEAKQKVADDAQLSEVEKAKKAATEAVAQAAQAVEALKAEQTARAVETAAFKLGLDPGLASALVTPAMLEYDDKTGKPTNVDAVLAALLKKWPQLKPAAAVFSGINATDGRGGSPPANPELRKHELTKRYRIKG
jgi:uncharacterized membrane protein YqiK